MRLLRGACDRASTRRLCCFARCRQLGLLCPSEGCLHINTSAKKPPTALLPQVSYPKRTDKPLYKGLVTQLESLSIPFLDAEQLQQHALAEQYDLVLDSMFGFSFKGAPRPPFDKLLEVSLACTGSAASASCLQHWRWLQAGATALMS